MCSSRWIFPARSFFFQLGFRKSLNISYADKFLDEIQKRFRDEYKTDLKNSEWRECPQTLFDEILLESYNRTFPFRVIYEQVLDEVERAADQAAKMPRAPRSYDESDKKLKNQKIVTKKSDVQAEENKKKKPKAKATSSKVVQRTVEEEEEEEENETREEEEAEVVKETPNTTEVKGEETMAVEDGEESPNEDRIPLEELQPGAMSIRDKLQSMGKKPAPFSKAAAK